MPIRNHHDANDGDDVFVRNGFLEKITHRVDEDHLGLSPFEWLVQLLRNRSWVEPLLIRMIRNISKSFGEAFGVTVGASGTDLHAAPNGIPRGLCPFDFRV